MDRPVIATWCADPLAAEGVAAMLGDDSDLEVVAIERAASADLVLIVSPTVDARVTDVINQVCLQSAARIILVVDELTDADLALATNRPVVAVLARSAVSARSLVGAVRAVYGGRAMPRIADQVERVGFDLLRPRGASEASLPAREQQVLRLLAEGCDTSEIANRMAYSERTVKNIIRAILERLGSKNRAHAVAYATRVGII